MDNANAIAGVLLVLAGSACASPKGVVGPVRPAPSPRARLAAAAAQVRAGCFDCLVSAFQAYDSLRSTASVADQASIGAARSAALLAMRERELGTEDTGYLTRARDIGAASPPAQQAVGVLLEIADTLPLRGGGRQVSDDVQLSRMQAAYRSRDAWIERLRAGADQDPLSAYLWIAFSCAYTPAAEQTLEQWLTSVPAWRETPLVTLKAATCGTNIDRPSLERLLEADPRFVEIHYFLGLGLAFTGKIDAAMDHLLQAYAWRGRWPAVTSSLGVDYIALEEFQQAAEFFDRTLAVVPRDADALLNKAKALTYAGRYRESLETVERLLALEHWLVGDARCWR